MGGEDGGAFLVKENMLLVAGGGGKRKRSINSLPITPAKKKGRGNKGKSLLF